MCSLESGRSLLASARRSTRKCRACQVSLTLSWVARTTSLPRPTWSSSTCSKRFSTPSALTTAACNEGMLSAAVHFGKALVPYALVLSDIDQNMSLLAQLACGMTVHACATPPCKGAVSHFEPAGHMYVSTSCVGDSYASLPLAGVVGYSA